MTFLLADVKDASELWSRDPDGMREAVHLRDRLFDDVVREHEGIPIPAQDEGSAAVFVRPSKAADASIELQRALGETEWPEGCALRLRVAVHAGDAAPREGRYFGPSVNRCAKLRAIAHPGQILITRGTAEMTRASLPVGAELRDLGPQRLADLLRPETVFQLCHPELDCDFPPQASLDAAPNNLPAFLTAFVGRESDVQKIAALLAQSDVRLVTLTGPGGIGKTRLACHAAAEAVPRFDGVWFVPLAGVTGPDQVAAATARELHLADRPGSPPEDMLVDRLSLGHPLLVADNFEHVTAAAGLVERLLLDCAGLTVLVTSREPLGIAGEIELAVRSLAVPTSGSPAQVVAQSAAVELFVDRMRAVRPDFTLDDVNASAVGELCRRLDGIPLALELAAARGKVLSPRDLLRRISTRADALSTTARGVPERHRTLQAAIEWSYDLLSAGEQRLWMWLSVFRGGFSLEGAEAVCAPVEIDVVDGLSSLVSKSLVEAAERPGGEMRFRMLESLRQFAAGRLDQTSDQDRARESHALWLLGMAELAWGEFAGPAQAEWLRRLDAEHDNFREALDWCAAGDGRSEMGLRLAGLLGSFWAARGHLTSGRELLERALERVTARTDIRAQALRQLARLALDQGDAVRARECAEEGIAIARELGAESAEASASVLLARAHRSEGNLDQASAICEAALSQSRRIADEGGMANALVGLGAIAQSTQEYDRSRSLFEESLVLYRGRADKMSIANVLNHLAALRLAQGDLDGAAAYWQEALSIDREMTNRQGIAARTGNLGLLAFYRGDLGESLALYEETCAQHRLLGDRRGVAISLASLGGVAHLTGDYARARSLYEDGLALWRQVGHKDGIAAVLLNLAILAADSGRTDDARRLYDDVTPLARELHDRHMSAYTDFCRGELSLLDGDHDAAVALFEDASAVFGELGDQRSRGGTLSALARAWYLKGDGGAASRLQAEALAAVRSGGDLPGVARCLEQAGVFAAAEPARAARLWGAAQAIRDRTGAQSPLYLRDWAARCVAQTGRRMGADALAKSMDEGRSLTLAEAVAEALELLEEGPSPAATEYVFRRDDAGWLISYEAEKCRLKDMKGLGYLSDLLARPGRELHVLQLAGLAGTGTPHAIAALEAEAEQAARDNDPVRADRARRELESLWEVFARDAGERAEQVRLNVTKTIHRALSVIEQHDPNLASHLHATVRTGMFCAYVPDPRSIPGWQL